jgi:uracil-DNA glycosylase family 4
MFVCESPVPIGPLPGAKPNECDENKWAGGDFEIGGIKGYRTWDGYNRTAARFLRFREEEGLGSCWITNVVKCGRLEGKNEMRAIDDKPEPLEIQNCARHLVREIEMVEPLVLACMGDWAFTTTVAFLGRKLNVDVKPTPIKFWHYAAHASDQQVTTRWKGSLLEVRKELRARKVSPFQPLLRRME